MENWDLFDENRVFTGRIIQRGKLPAKTDFHQIVHVWLKYHDVFLISKRHPSIFFGGFWQPTGGCVVSGDTSFETALKETNEELGLNLSNQNAEFLFWYKNVPEKTPSFFLDAWLFDITSLVEQEKDEHAFLQNLILQKNEVADVRFARFDEIMQLWRDGLFMPYEQTFLPYFDVLKEKIAKKNSTAQIIDLQKQGIQALKTKTPTPELDTAVLLSSIFRKPREYFILHQKDYVDDFTAQRFFELLERRKTGEPIAYITGKKFFWNNEFIVDKNTLIPKPDTELAVEKVLEIIQNQPSQKKIKILDLCTGSGCIILSVLSDLQNTDFFDRIEAFAIDISEAALKIARQNEQSILQQKKITFMQSDLFVACKHSFDIIVTNPPYVPTALVKKLLEDGRAEPSLALDGGFDGLDLVKKIIAQSKDFLNEKGFLLIETGEYNASKTRNLLTDSAFCHIKTFKDWQGNERLTIAQKEIK
ncbi:MAG: peptide chain release factor N(5)-glutamine methyltransferase [Treponemataceae bacterium]